MYTIAMLTSKPLCQSCGAGVHITWMTVPRGSQTLLPASDVRRSRQSGPRSSCGWQRHHHASPGTWSCLLRRRQQSRQWQDSTWTHLAVHHQYAPAVRPHLIRNATLQNIIIRPECLKFYWWSFYSGSAMLAVQPLYSCIATAVSVRPSSVTRLLCRDEWSYDHAVFTVVKSFYTVIHNYRTP